ncbi:MAG: PKD domain-containing protein, partial [Cytophagales bacterium]
QSGIAVSKVKAVTVYPLPRVSFSASVSCQAQNALLTNTSQDKLNYSFTWYYGDGTEANFENPTKKYNNAGTYPVELKSISPQGCEAKYAATMVVSTVPAFSFGDSIFTCGNSYLLNAENAGASYLWSTNENAQSISIASSGNYSVQVTNGSSCVASKTVFVTLNAPAKINLGQDAIVCSQYELKAKQPGSYLWSTGETSGAIEVNTSGNYWIEFTDQNACVDRDTVSLNVIANPMVNLGADLVKCSNENTSLDAQNAGSTYQWSSGADTQNIAISQSGLYRVTVTSANLCAKSDEILVQINQAPKISLGADKTVCANDFPISISTNSLNDVYNWSTGASTNSISVVSADTYYVTATGSNTCIAKDTLVVSENPSPTINLGSVTSFCFGETLTLDAGNAGANFAWSNGINTQTAAISASGNYFVSVTNTNGCSNTSSISIIENSLPQLALPTTFSRCNNQLPLMVNAPSGFAQYLWNTGAISPELSTTLAGNYWLEATDANGCVGKDTVEVKIDIAPVVNLGKDTSFCVSKSFTLDASSLADVSFLWSDATTDRFKTLTISGTLSVDVTTAEGCKTSDEIFVKANPLPIVDLGTDRTLCVGAASNLDAQNAGSTYLWSTGETSQTISANNNGLYLVTVTNTFNCKATDNIVVDVINLPGKSLPEDVASCNAVTLNAGNPGAVYLWSNGANTQSTKAQNTGLYIVNITNGTNCLTRDSILVTINPKPLVNLGRDTILCKYQTLTLDAKNAGAAYFWSNINVVSRTVSVAEPGTYSVSVTNQFQCSASDSIKLSQNPVPEFSLGEDKNICEANSINLTTSLPVNTQFLWSNGSTANTITTSSTGVYTLKASFATGCEFEDTVNVNVRPLPVVKLGNDTIVCGQILLDAKNLGSSYVWSNNVITQTNSIKQSGNYNVKVTSPFGCVAADTINVNIKSAPIVNLGPDLGVCSGEKVELFANTDADQYKWNTGQTVSNLIVDSPGEYILEATNANGCKSSDAIFINFNPKPVVDLQNEYPLCGDNAVKLDAQNAGSSYLWTSSNGFVSSQQKVSLFKEGNYYLTVLNGNSCQTKDTIKVNKTDFSLTAEFLAVSSVKAGDTVKMINLSFPAPFTSTWDFGDGLVSRDTDPLHVYFISGGIDVKLSVTNGICTDVKNKTIFLTARLGMVQDSAKKESAFLNSKVYPNPSDGRFILEVSLSEIRKMSLEFYDISGNMIHSSTLEPNDFFHTVFDFPTLPTGMYFLRASLKDEYKMFKVLISK